LPREDYRGRAVTELQVLEVGSLDLHHLPLSHYPASALKRGRGGRDIVMGWTSAAPPTSAT